MKKNFVVIIRAFFKISLYKCFLLFLLQNIDIRETLIRLELARLEFDEDVFPTTNSRLLQDRYDIQSVSSSLLAENDLDIRDETDSSTY